MYMKAGNAAYRTSTGLTRLKTVKLSPRMAEKASWIDSPCLSPADILHEHHYIRVVEVPGCVSPNC
jgi:hypothetical protein